MKDLLRIFNKHQVNYAICGGFAVAHYGFVRMTLDLDLLVDPTVENSQKIMAALKEFGFGEAGITAEDFQNPATAVTLGAQPNQIDLLTKMSSSTSKEVIQNAVPSILEGIEIRVVSKADLIRAKKEANRPKDQIDIIELEKE